MKFAHTNTNLPIENEYPKLVRDRIPEIIEADGREAETRTLNDKEYETYLKKKVLEEAQELFNAKTDEHILEEAADLAEIVDALVEHRNYTRQDIDVIQKQKRLKRGGFKNRILMLGYKK